MPYTAAGSAAAPALFSNPYTAAAAAIPFAIKGLRSIGSGRRAANRGVSGYENPFGDELAEVSRLIQSGDTDQAKTRFESAYSTYMGGVNEAIAQGGKDELVAKQSLSNPSLWQTVRSIANTLGVTLPETTTPTTLPTTTQTTPMPTVFGVPVNFGNTPPYVAGPTPTGGGENIATGRFPLPELPDFPINVNIGGGGGGSGGTTPTQPPADPEKSWWETYAPWILFGLGAGADIYSGFSQASAAKEAAQIMADAANRGIDLQRQTTEDILGLQREMWETGRADIMPFQRSAIGAQGMLNNLMGIPATETGINQAALPFSRPGQPMRQNFTTPQQGSVRGFRAVRL